MQESHVVLVELPNVRDLVPAGADPLDAQSESETGDLLRIVSDGAEDVRIDHARAAHLDPAAVPAHVDFDARFGEREERGAEADVDVVLEEAASKQPQHAFQVGHRDVAIDQQALDLVEHGVMGGVGRVGAIDASQGDDPHRRLGLLHDADLHRAGLAAQQQPVLRPGLGERLRRGQVEVVQRVAGGMLGRDVQGLEIVPIVLHFGAIGHGEPQPAHDVFEFLEGLGDRVEMAQTRANAGDRRIETRRLGGGSGGVGDPLRSLFQGGLDLLFDLVESFAGGGLVGFIDAAEPLLRGLQPPTLEPDEGDPRSFDAWRIASCSEGRRGLAGQPVQFGQEISECHGKCRRLYGGCRRNEFANRRDDLIERRGIVHRQIGQNLAIQHDACLVQPVDELAVADPSLADRRIDADDPQAAELTLPDAAVAVGIDAGSDQRFLGGPQQTTTSAHESFDFVEETLLGLVSGRTFGGSHDSPSKMAESRPFPAWEAFSCPSRGLFGRAAGPDTMAGPNIGLEISSYIRSGRCEALRPRPF